MEFIKMMLWQLGGEEFFIEFPKNNDTFKKLTDFYKNPNVYVKINQTPQDAATDAMKSKKPEENEQIEAGFVDGLFEMFKL